MPADQVPGIDLRVWAIEEGIGGHVAHVCNLVYGGRVATVRCALGPAREWKHVLWSSMGLDGIRGFGLEPLSACPDCLASRNRPIG